MPVTLQIVDHEATEWTGNKVSDSEQLLKEACPTQYRRSKELIQSSFTTDHFRDNHVSPSENGFVWAAYHAYSDHHHLVIRPDDVWFSILTQLSFFINANAEELRSFFVAHSGQKHLHLEVDHLDFAVVADKMTDLIAKNVVDPDLRDWVMPSYSTTEYTDKIVGAILFMGAMQKYFTYGVSVTCGIPSVTLLGEVDDWKDILKRIDKIELLGEEPTQFAKMLRPIVQNFILSFEKPDSFEVTQFWNTIVHRVSLMSGTDYLTGWLTAFCFWSSEGEAKRLSEANVMFDDVPFPQVDIDEVPVGFASVPIEVDDLGDMYDATMVAGSVGITATPGPNSERRDTIQPLSGWWVCRSETTEDKEARDAEKAQIEAELEKDNDDFHAMLKLYRRLEELEAY